MVIRDSWMDHDRQSRVKAGKSDHNRLFKYPRPIGGQNRRLNIDPDSCHGLLSCGPTIGQCIDRPRPTPHSPAMPLPVQPIDQNGQTDRQGSSASPVASRRGAHNRPDRGTPCWTEPVAARRVQYVWWHVRIYDIPHPQSCFI